ncbi:MAG TPA: hypothetical protein VKK79_01040 [Candidatus Lokiarchaeia archaeon]|nr:hypothetical protein [Candidatus Lokiarchaeia archaeon]
MDAPAIYSVGGESPPATNDLWQDFGMATTCCIVARPALCWLDSLATRGGFIH